MISKKKKGVALLWVTVLSGVLIIISTTMANYIVKESQFSIRSDQSSQAYSYARSGIDWAIYYTGKVKPTTGSTNSFNLDGIAGNDVIVNIIIGGPTGDCSSPALYCIVSTGMVKSTTRTLEYKVSPTNYTVIAPNPAPADIAAINGISVGTNQESFNFQFDFWAPNIHPFYFGLQDPTGVNKIYTRYDFATKTMYLEGNLGGTITRAQVLDASTPPGGFDITAGNNLQQPYVYRVQIKYIKDTAARMVLFKRDLITAAYNCVGATTIDLTGKNFGNLSRLYLFTTSPEKAKYVTGGEWGDGSYILTFNDSNDLEVPRNIIDNIYIQK